MGASQIFGWVVAQSNIGVQIGHMILAVSDNPLVILVELNILFLIIGMIMDPLAALIIFVPIFLPIAQASVGRFHPLRTDRRAQPDDRPEHSAGGLSVVHDGGAG